MSRPTVEVADIFRTQGKAFIDRHRTRMRFQQLKVMQAIVRCRTAALGGHVDRCLRCGKAGASPLTHAGIAIVRSVRLKHGAVGSPPESENSWPLLTSMWCSVCRTN